MHKLPTRHLGPVVAALCWLGFAGMAIWAMAAPSHAAGSGLSLAIGLLTLFVGAIVASFSLRYMRADGRQAQFFPAMAALIGLVLTFLFAGNVLALGLAWCASGWVLARLIGHAAGWAEARAAARRARLAFLVGDTALVLAVVLLASHAGSLALDVVLAKASHLPLATAHAIALLLVVAAAARCALPPFSGWLLSSMTAPTPVSALMHAGLVNAGGFLLIRFSPVLEAAPAARGLAVVAGLAGAIYGTGIMLVRPDVKRALAGSTVAQMSFMIMSCGLGAYAAAIWHVIAHGLFKAWLFLGSGSAIGMKASGPQRLSGRSAAAIAGLTLALGLTLTLNGQADASVVPLLLGLATAAATVVTAMAGTVALRAKVALLLALVALIALHGAGLLVAGSVVSASAAPLVPDWVLLVLLGTFLGAWAWQQAHLASGRGLPLRLYVHLINAGALRVPAHGEAQ